MFPGVDYPADIECIVHELKVDRDTWQAVALQFKAAFKDQTRRLQELQDICFAAQAELENERAQRRTHADLDRAELHRGSPIDGTDDAEQEQSFGTAAIFTPSQMDADWLQRLPDDSISPLFKKVQQAFAERNFGTALVEVERLLCGPLSPKARAAGLLLKSNILRASGPNELYVAMAACSEALELCNRASNLESFLQPLQYQWGLLFFDLRMLHRAQEDFSSLSDDDILSAKGGERRGSYEDDGHLRITKRRSGFDENRTATGALLAQLEDQAESKRRRTSTQLRHAAARAKRMSMPYRWVAPKSEGG